jgi:hypothetical protein
MMSAGDGDDGRWLVRAQAGRREEGAFSVVDAEAITFGSEQHEQK